jgi:hypothetical protein
MAKQEDGELQKRNTASDARGSERVQKPVYEKPRLRRYDQIEQVKPYGPREL